MNDKYKKYEPIFGSWSLGRPLGRGSFGEVYEITREEYGTTYKAALKVISVPQEDDDIKSRMAEGTDIDTISDYYEGVLKEIINENEIMSRLKGNTNIVSYEDHQIIAHEDGIGYDILIRMELLTPLLDRMLENKLNENEVVKLGIDMCRALELCHKKNIIHRDIKPQNIFVSENGDYKLGDFGIARTIEKASGGMSKKGTYKYMAPEVFRGEEYDSTVDIYSLGIVMYSLLNGNRGPFLPPPPAKITHNDEENARLRRFRGEEIPRAQNASTMLSYIIGKACKANPAERYGTAEQMRADLESYLSNYESLQTVASEETVYDATAPMQTTSSTGYAGATYYAASHASYADSRNQPYSPQDVKKRRNHKTVPIAMAVCAVLLIAIGGIGFLFAKSVHRTAEAPADTIADNTAEIIADDTSYSLDLAKLMIEPEVSGYSGRGILDTAITVDESKKQIITDNAKDDEEKEKLNQLFDSIVYTVERREELSNGDVIKIHATYNTDLANELKATVTGTEIDYTVKNLDDYPAYLAGATEFNGHYYKVINESLYWSEARAECERENGHLATITSSEEQSFIMDLIEETGTKYNYWLGGEDAGHEDTWTWITGEPWSYSNWRVNQPDNGSIGHERAQDYLAICMVSSEDTGRYGMWWDNSDDGVSKNYVQAPYYKDTQYYGYIVEWDEI